MATFTHAVRPCRPPPASGVVNGSVRTRFTGAGSDQPYVGAEEGDMPGRQPVTNLDESGRSGPEFDDPSRVRRNRLLDAVQPLVDQRGEQPGLLDRHAVPGPVEHREGGAAAALPARRGHVVGGRDARARGGPTPCPGRSR